MFDEIIILPKNGTFIANTILKHTNHFLNFYLIVYEK